jgi:Flp pilus assembly protein TadG
VRLLLLALELLPLQGRRGSNAVEFALVLPVFVVMIFGMMEFSWVFFQPTTVVQAVRNGCRAGAIVHPDGDERGAPADVAQDSIEGHLSDLGIDCSWGWT